MPVHVSEFASEVTVVDGDLPLTRTQIDKLVKLVCEQIEKQKRARQQAEDATEIRSSVGPDLNVG